MRSVSWHLPLMPCVTFNSRYCIQCIEKASLTGQTGMLTRNQPFCFTLRLHWRAARGKPRWQAVRPRCVESSKTQCIKSEHKLLQFASQLKS